MMTLPPINLWSFSALVAGFMAATRSKRMTNDTLIIYHGGCDDGFGAAFAAYLALGNNAKYIPASYSDPTLPAGVDGADVYILDFSYKRPVMRELLARAHRVTILDHHKTADDELRDMLGAGPHGILHGVIDTSRSGAVLAWNWFHFTPPPTLFEYLQARDLWQKDALPFVDEFTLALRSYPQDFRTWWSFRTERGVNLLIEEGRHIKRFYDIKVRETAEDATLMEIRGRTVKASNCQYAFASDVANVLADEDPTGFAACYFRNKHGKWQFSLRSKAGSGMDVSEIAKCYGGGGHTHAAWFELQSLEALW